MWMTIGILIVAGTALDIVLNGFSGIHTPWLLGGLLLIGANLRLLRIIRKNNDEKPVKIGNWLEWLFVPAVLTVIAVISLQFFGVNSNSLTRQLQKADVYQQQGEYVKAFEILEPLTGEYPEELDLKNRLGELLLIQNRYSEATKLFNEVLAIKATDSRARQNLLKCLLQEQNYSKAADEARYLMKLNPHISSAYEALGDIAMKSNDLIRTEYYYTLAKREAVNSISPYLKLSTAYQSTHSIDKAYKEADMALQLAGNVQDQQAAVHQLSLLQGASLFPEINDMSVQEISLELAYAANRIQVGRFYPIQRTHQLESGLVQKLAGEAELLKSELQEASVKEVNAETKERMEKSMKAIDRILTNSAVHTASKSKDAYSTEALQSLIEIQSGAAEYAAAAITLPKLQNDAMEAANIGLKDYMSIENDNDSNIYSILSKAKEADTINDIKLLELHTAWSILRDKAWPQLSNADFQSLSQGKEVKLKLEAGDWFKKATTWSFDKESLIASASAFRRLEQYNLYAARLQNVTGNLMKSLQSGIATMDRYQDLVSKENKQPTELRMIADYLGYHAPLAQARDYANGIVSTKRNLQYNYSLIEALNKQLRPVTNVQFDLVRNTLYTSGDAVAFLPGITESRKSSGFNALLLTLGKWDWAAIELEPMAGIGINTLPGSFNIPEIHPSAFTRDTIFLGSIAQNINEILSNMELPGIAGTLDNVDFSQLSNMLNNLADQSTDLNSLFGSSAGLGNTTASSSPNGVGSIFGNILKSISNLSQSVLDTGLGSGIGSGIGEMLSNLLNDAGSSNTATGQPQQAMGSMQNIMNQLGVSMQALQDVLEASGNLQQQVLDNLREVGATGGDGSTQQSLAQIALNQINNLMDGMQNINNALLDGQQSPALGSADVTSGSGGFLGQLSNLLGGMTNKILNQLMGNDLQNGVFERLGELLGPNGVNLDTLLQSIDDILGGDDPDDGENNTDDGSGSTDSEGGEPGENNAEEEGSGEGTGQGGDSTTGGGDNPGGDDPGGDDPGGDDPGGDDPGGDDPGGDDPGGDDPGGDDPGGDDPGGDDPGGDDPGGDDPGGDDPGGDDPGGDDPGGDDPGGDDPGGDDPGGDDPGGDDPGGDDPGGDDPGGDDPGGDDPGGDDPGGDDPGGDDPGGDNPGGDDPGGDDGTNEPPPLPHPGNNGIPVLKPNIYIYPATTVTVSVEFIHPDDVTASIPLYNPKDGWFNTISPGGKIDGQYDYLFYEAVVESSYFQQSEGWLLTADNRIKIFEYILGLYGFNDKESKDFIEFWTEKLEENKDYIMYPQETSRIDMAMPVRISPQPDNIFRLWFYFAPAEGKTVIKPVDLDPINRQGYSVVEWGGMVQE